LKKQKSSRTSASKSNFSLKVNTKCNYGSKGSQRKEVEEVYEANGKLRTKFQELTLEQKKESG